MESYNILKKNHHLCQYKLLPRQLLTNMNPTPKVIEFVSKPQIMFKGDPLKFHMIKLYTHLSEKQIELCGLVLTSAGIFYRTKNTESGWMILVNDHDFTRASNSMYLYFNENPELEVLEPIPVGKFKNNFTGIGAALILMAFYMAVGTDRQLFVTTYGASASHILQGEIYRAVTALLLHADTVHLIANMAAIAVFGSAVASIMGTGVGWLLILATGTIGNILNACLYQAHHMAVGASTAVFGAIGILSGYQFWKKIRRPGERIKAWLPLGGGLALLAMLGSGGGRVDVMAHLFGFFVGLGIETVYDFLIKRKPPMIYQALGMFIFIAIIVASWGWPIWTGKE